MGVGVHAFVTQNAAGTTIKRPGIVKINAGQVKRKSEKAVAQETQGKQWKVHEVLLDWDDRTCLG